MNTIANNIPVSRLETSPRPPDLRLHVLEDYDLDEIFGYINPQMLYVRHLGYRGRFWEALRNDEPKAVALRRQVQRVEDIMLSRSDISANAVFKFFPCRSEGQWLIVYESDGTTELARFYFGRQEGKDGLCLTDYIRPVGDGPNDYLAMFATTVGPGVRELSERWKNTGALPGLTHATGPGHRIGGRVRRAVAQTHPQHVEHRRAVRVESQR